MTKVVIDIDDDVMDKAKALYESLGMSLSDAVNAFLRRSVAGHGMPSSSAGDDADGYPRPPHHEARRIHRSESGRLMLPSDWDDPADWIYDE